MRVKDNSVSLVGCSPQIFWGLSVVENVLNKYGVDTVITSGSEQSTTHSTTSLHYSGNALDIRNRELSPVDQLGAQKPIKECLGVGFDFIIKSNHFHLEFKPKKR